MQTRPGIKLDEKCFFLFFYNQLKLILKSNTTTCTHHGGNRHRVIGVPTMMGTYNLIAVYQNEYEQRELQQKY